MNHLDIYDYLANTTQLVEFSRSNHTSFDLHNFDCGDDSYNNFLSNEAEAFDALGVSKTHLLIDNKSEKIMGYISLNFSQILITPEEKLISGMTGIPFSAIPAINVGKIATDVHWRNKGLKLGSYLLFLAYGIASEIEDCGIAARFLILDADIENDETLVGFYKKNNFIVNIHKQYTSRKGKVSMRYDLFK